MITDYKVKAYLRRGKIRAHCCNVCWAPVTVKLSFKNLCTFLMSQKANRCIEVV